MTSRERVQAALEHQEPDRVPLDLGGSHQTGMHVDSVYKLRQALQLESAGYAGKNRRPVPATGRDRTGSARRSWRRRGAAPKARHNFWL